MSEADFLAKYEPKTITESDVIGKIARLDIPQGPGENSQAVLYFKADHTFAFTQRENKDDMDPDMETMPAVESGTWAIVDGTVVATGSDGKVNTLVMTNKPETNTVQYAELFSKESLEDGSIAYFGPLYMPEIDTVATITTDDFTSDIGGVEITGTDTWTEWDGTTVTEEFTVSISANNTFSISFVRNGVAEETQGGNWSLQDSDHLKLTIVDDPYATEITEENSMTFNVYFVKDGTGTITHMYGMIPGDPFGPQEITVAPAYN
jgi:hypothetical protein